MKKLFSLLVVLFIISALFASLTACGGGTAGPQKLDAPAVTLTGNIATWQANPNADKFEVSINGTLSYLENSVTEKALSNGESFKVRAVGDGTSYATSDWSNIVTYTQSGDGASPIKLNAPTVTLSNTGLASWQAVAGANGYTYKISGGAEVNTAATSVQLSDGQSLVVKAVGDGASYATSDWSNIVTYTPSGNPPTPTKLNTPTVTLSNTGLASWQAIAGANGYTYKINGGAEVNTAATSIQLSDGQSIVVKAVGDGVNYTDSDYSASKTYTSGSVSQTDEPAYLGIFASATTPSQADGLPEALIPANLLRSGGLATAEYRDCQSVLSEYFEAPENRFSTELPIESEYDIYSTENGVIYIQIWLNNPNQYTILSLMLNGTKYQVGGGLTSFFIEESGEYFNCVYAAVTIPEGAHTELTYTVSNIEYIENTYINADGTDEFMNNNDTITVGLPYDAIKPSLLGYECNSLTHNSYSARINISDHDNMLSKCGGWIGIAVYDDNMNFKIISNQAAVIGENIISVSGLVEGSYYSVIVYLYADLHDGMGLRAHYLLHDWVETESAIELVEVESDAVMNEKNTGYVGALRVKAELKSPTASFVRLEILDKGGEVVYTDTDFDGSDIVSDGILNNAFYTVRVYYKDNEYPEGKYVEEVRKVMPLSELWLGEDGKYTFVNDAIYKFDFNTESENYPAVDSFVIRFFDDESARYIADDVLLLMENPNIIDELWDEWNSLGNELSNYEDGSPEREAIGAQRKAIYYRIQEIGEAERLWKSDEHFNSNSDKAFWQAEKSKGRYYYEYSYSGTDTENIVNVDGTYYVILSDVMDNCGGQYKVQVVAQLNKNEGNGLFEKEYDARNIDLRTMFYEEMYGVYETTGIKNAALEGNQFTFTVYNTHDVKLDGEESNKNKMFLYKINASNGETLYFNETAATPEIDEAEWIEQYIIALKAGTLDEAALYNTYVPEYAASQTVTFDLSELDAGKYDLFLYFRTYDKVYEGDESEDSCVAYDVAVYKKFETPTLTIDGCYAYVTFSDTASRDDLVFEAYDKNNEPIEISDLQEQGWEDGKYTYRFEFAYVGAKVRVKLAKQVWGDEVAYWLDSDPTAYCDSQAQALAAPEFSKETYSTWLSWSTTDSQYIDRYVYTVNGGDENSGDGCNLGQNCTVKVKAIASSYGKENGYCDSEWSTYTYTRPTGGGKG